MSSEADHSFPAAGSAQDGHDAVADKPETPPTAGEGQMSFVNQAIRFFLVGILSAVVDYGLLQILMFFAHLGYPIAKAISFVAGTITAYLLNRRFTFQADHSWRRFATVMGLYVLMFAVQWGIFTPVTALLLREGLSQYFASTIGFVLGQGVATVTNFVVQRTVIFKSQSPKTVEIAA